MTAVLQGWLWRKLICHYQRIQTKPNKKTPMGKLVAPLANFPLLSLAAHMTRKRMSLALTLIQFTLMESQIYFTLPHLITELTRITHTHTHTHIRPSRPSLVAGLLDCIHNPVGWGCTIHRLSLHIYLFIYIYHPSQSSITRGRSSRLHPQTAYLC